jgi:hypothetical protein
MPAKTIDAIFLESLIARAYQLKPSVSLSQREKIGATDYDFKAIVYFEEGNSFMKQKEYDKVIQKIKSNLMDAFDKFLSFKLTETEKMQLEKLKPSIQFANDSESILEIVDKANDITQRFQNY